MNLRILIRVLSLGMLGTTLLSPMWAQSTGRLSGIVRDPSGATVSDAVVSLYRPGMTQPSEQTKTTNSGFFEFDALPPESYRVTIEKPGFAAYEATNVQLSPGTETPLNGIQLELGQQPTVVNASERLLSVQNSNAEISTTLTTEQLERLPILNRNPLSLIQTQAGVVGQAGAGSAAVFTTINGLRTSYSNVTLDGINVQDNTVRYNGLDVVPNNLVLGQVNQFTLITSNQSAIYGNGATQTAFASPSGSNELHGSVFYLNSNNLMNANPWFANRIQLKDSFKNNEGGFTVGGPLLKQKLFGYAEYELYRRRDTLGESTPTLSADNRSLISAFQAAGLQIDPIVSAVLGKIPLANTADGSQFQHAEASQADADNATARLDFVPSQRSTIVASYLYNRLNTGLVPSNYGNRFALVERSKAHLVSGSWRFTPSGRLTNEVRAGANIAPIAFINRERTTPYILNLGFFENLNPVSSAGNQGRRLGTYDFQDNGSYVFGRHNLQFGLQIQLIRIRSYTENGSVPTIFLGTGKGDLLDVASGLAGIFRQVDQHFNPVNRTGALGAVPSRYSLSLDNYAPYIQDNWKVNRKLAVTLGLRYDYYTPFSDQNGTLYTPRLVSGNLRDTFGSSTLTYDLKGSGFYSPDRNNFAPSVGVAFDPFGNGRTAFRAAYGISYVNDDFTEALRFVLAENQFFVGQTIAPSGLLSNFTPLAPPQGGTSVTRSNPFGFGNALGLIDPATRTPYVQQWSAGVQQELGGYLLDLRYLGNHAVKLLREDRFTSQTAALPNTVYFTSNPSGSRYNALQFDISRRFHPNLQFQANYTFAKVLTDSDVIASALRDPYRSQDNHRLDQGPARFDLRHAFKANAIYDLPFGRGSQRWLPLRPLLGGWSISAIAVAQSGEPFSILSDPRFGNQTAGALIGGDALNRIVSYHMTGYGPSIIASSAINAANGSGVGGFANQVFFAPPPGSPGFLQPRSFYNPASFDLDLGIQKRFRLTEHQSIELRGVAVNVLNHPSFHFGDQSIISPAFGGSSAAGRDNVFTLYQPRTVQLSVYYRF
jgi:hypothetical protein